MKRKINILIFLIVACPCIALTQNLEKEIKLILPHPFFSKPNNSYIGEKYAISYRKSIGATPAYISYAIFDNANFNLVYSGIIYSDKNNDDENFDLTVNGGTLTDNYIEIFFQEKKPGKTDTVINDELYFRDNDFFIRLNTSDKKVEVYSANDISKIKSVNSQQLYTYIENIENSSNISISSDFKHIGVFINKRIYIYDMNDGTLVWSSKKLKNKSISNFKLLNNNILITSLAVDNNKFHHIKWYNFKTDSLVFNTSDYLLKTIVKTHQGYKYLALQYGGAESKKPVSTNYIDLSYGKFSTIETFNKDRKFSLGWYVQDSLAKNSMSDFEYTSYFENYTKYTSDLMFYIYYYGTYTDPETGQKHIVKDIITPMTVDVDFFYDNNSSIVDIENGKKYEIVSAYDNKVTYFDITRNFKMYNITALNKELLFWNGNQKEKEKRFVKLIVSLDGTPVFFTLDNYYLSTKQAKNLISFLYNNKRYTFEQFDLKYNRPDIVLERLGYASPELIEAYHKAYQKRLRKMGFTEEQLSGEFHIPETVIENFEYMPVIEEKDLKLELNFNDSKYELDRYNIWLNDVPLFGMMGKSLKYLKTGKYSVKENILLLEGRNKIQVSCLNEKGAESYKETVEITYTPKEAAPSKLHFMGIGVDTYLDEGHNLKYSVKDIRDLSAALKQKYGTAITIDTLFNEQVSVENVKALKNKLLQTNINDKVIISFSGHGLLSSTYDYYLATHNTNFKIPEQGGLPYEDLEWLLDSIPARKKLLLIDACHSGEVDKEELLAMETTDVAEDVKGANIVYTYEPTLGIKNSFELMQELFANLNRGTGATVISAAAGNQFAYEKGHLRNGVFTYAILELMNSQKEITVSTLKAAVGKRVEELTNGLQKPTSRSESLDFDWRVW